jgi:aryl-alcohol dehydrogenase-like predicted oxidoreductase
LKIGISNYTAKGVEEFLSVCDKNGWTKPTVYQGQYNAVCRKRETELFPLLRKHGIKFYAYR